MQIHAGSISLCLQWWRLLWLVRPRYAGVVPFSDGQGAQYVHHEASKPTSPRQSVAK